MAKRLSKAAATVKKRAKKRGVKMRSPKRGRESAMLPPLPMPFREALADYLKVKPEDMQPPTAAERKKVAEALKIVQRVKRQS